MSKKKLGYFGLASALLCLAVVAAYYSSSTLNASAHMAAFRNGWSTRATQMHPIRRKQTPVPATSTPQTTPTSQVVATPTVVPTSIPTVVPTSVPTSIPTVAPTATPQPVTSSYPSDTDAAAAVLKLINQEREGQNLADLTWNTGLQASAHKHNLAMAAANTMSHQLPGEAPFGDRERAEGVNWWSAAENITWSSINQGITTTETADALNTGLFNETAPDNGHRLNILSSSSNVVGVDVIVDTTNHKIWLTEDFAQI